MAFYKLQGYAISHGKIIGFFLIQGFSFKYVSSACLFYGFANRIIRVQSCDPAGQGKVLGLFRSHVKNYCCSQWEEI